MRNMRSWTTLSGLVGFSLSAEQIVASIGTRSGSETMFTLARILADIANATGPVNERERVWTHDLLTQRIGSTDPHEQAIAVAVSRLPFDSVIAHAHVLFVLQVLAVARGAAEAPPGHDGHLAFLMLALNDHLPEWPRDASENMSETERLLAQTFLSTIFNRFDDPMRFIVRVAEIMRYAPPRLSKTVAWSDVEHAAFGTSFQEYVETFLVPIFFSSRIWDESAPPIIFAEDWTRFGTRQELFARWMSEASMSLTDAAKEFGTRVLPSGLLGLPPAYFRTPFLNVDGKYVGLSPWHVRDHAVLGTWWKLNVACKNLLHTTSIQVFSSAWGIMFEKWCASLAHEVAEIAHLTERIVLPSQPGHQDEIEDIIFHDGDVVALLSAKASLVPEVKLKAAESQDEPVEWLTRFFFEDASAAKEKGYRGGAIVLLDRKIADVRSGKYESRGIPRNATILPCVVSFDNVGESAMLYSWLEDEALKRNLLTQQSVRPLTVITPEDYEALLALRAKGKSICQLLLRKTQLDMKYGALDHLLFDEVTNATELRLPSIVQRAS